MNELVADVEGNGFIPELHTMWCLGVGDPTSGEVIVYSDTDPHAPPLQEGLDRLHKADKVWFHNGMGYDLFAINKLYPGTLKWSQIADTLLLARMLNPEGKHSLGIYGDMFGMSKGDVTRFDIFDPEMLPYCKRDVQIGMRLREWLLDKGMTEDKWGDSILLEHKVAFVIALQTQFGFRLNLEKAHALEVELRQDIDAISKELKEIFPPIHVPDKGSWCWKTKAWKGVETFTPKSGNKTMGRTKGVSLTKIKVQAFNPGSRTQIIHRFSKKYGWRPTKFTPTGAPQIDEAVLQDLRYPEAEPLRKYFGLLKQLGQLSDGKNSWFKKEQGGYVYGQVNTIGARTHRMSHFSPNMAQVDKKDLRMREVWEPHPGHKLVGCDAEGLELRMLAHYLWYYDKGEYANAVVYGKKEDETDAHSRTRKAAGLYSRDNAKTLIYAFLYGAGNVKLGLTVQDDAVQAGKKIKGQKGAIGGVTRKKLESGIKGLDRLVKLAQVRHKSRGWFKSLDGRWIKSASAHSSLNTLLQSAGSVVMKWALVIFHFELCREAGLVDEDYNTVGWGYCANVHDEVQLSAPEDKAEQLGELFKDAIRLAGERLNINCPLSGSKDIGDNWKETH